MEENKEKKTITLSLSTGVALIVIIMLSIVILSMAFFYNLRDLKIENEQLKNNTTVQSVNTVNN